MSNSKDSLHSCSHHHHHLHAHTHGTTTNSMQSIRRAFFINLSFTLIEMVGGWWTGSVAIMADAIHDLGDSVSLALALYLEKQSDVKSSTKFTYGLKRLSLLSALITGCVLVSGSILVVFHALQRFFSPPAEIHGLGMIGLAFLGLTVNGVAALQLRKGKTHNEQVLSWHFIEDVLGWAAVLLGAILIKYFNWIWVDPILALAIAAFIGWNGCKSLVQTIKVFLQSAPLDIDQVELKAQLVQVKGVLEVHDLHLWSLDGSRHVMTLHAVVDGTHLLPEIKIELRKVAQRYGAFFTTIEIELKEENCVENCN
ncbi:MAG: cation diffusion facilitator family transporter [Bdellovibrionales bacterium]|nr:cation diffusion facilitator family transporter [Bdellovibrionales bacterium]